MTQHHQPQQNKQRENASPSYAEAIATNVHQYPIISSTLDSPATVKEAENQPTTTFQNSHPDVGEQIQGTSLEDSRPASCLSSPVAVVEDSELQFKATSENTSQTDVEKSEVINLDVPSSAITIVIANAESDGQPRATPDELSAHQDDEEKDLSASSVTLDDMRADQEASSYSFPGENESPIDSNAEENENREVPSEPAQDSSSSEPINCVTLMGVCFPMRPGPSLRQSRSCINFGQDSDDEDDSLADDSENQNSENRNTENRDSENQDIENQDAERGEREEPDNDQDAEKNYITAANTNVDPHSGPDQQTSGYANQYGAEPASSYNSNGHIPANDHTAKGQGYGGGEMQRNISKNSVDGSSMAQHSQYQAEAPGQYSYVSICTHCGVQIAASQNSQISCPCCAPSRHIPYCSNVCLLADSYYHSNWCLQQHPRPAPGINQGSSHTRSTIYPTLVSRASAERFRQMAFSKFCSSGSFPPLFVAWARKVNYRLVGNFDENEWYKRTGDYAVFRSEVTGPAQRRNPDAEVIFT